MTPHESRASCRSSIFSTLDFLPRGAKAAFVVVATLAVAGCAGHATNVLLPTSSTAVGTSRVDMLVVTTREKTDTPGQLYGGERAAAVSATNIVVSIPPPSARKTGEVQWPRQLPANPETDFTTVKVDDVDRAGSKRWFSQVAGKRHKVLIFVHGYNTTFEDAAYRFAQIVHDSGTDAAPILFTWPSRGKVAAYLYDKESATYSRTSLETLLTTAATDPNVSDVTVMAHSMGNWVLAEALRQMAIRNRRILPKIKNVILAAPDLDVDVFRAQFQDIPEPRPLITVFVSQDDKALRLSQRISGGTDRLGLIDPDIEPYRSRLSAAKINVVDLTKVKAGDSFHHGKFAESPEVVQLIGNRLINGQQVDDTIDDDPVSQVAQTTMTAIGSTVGAIVPRQ